MIATISNRGRGEGRERGERREEEEG